MFYKNDDIVWLKVAGLFARRYAGCLKVRVGAVAVSEKGMFIAGAGNETDSDLCKLQGCLRIEKYGDNAKSHRNPDDCRAVHSEIALISKLTLLGVSLLGATLYITRYPCEACARAIVRTGVFRVVYGREQVISDMTKSIFDKSKIQLIHVPEYKEKDVTT